MNRKSVESQEQCYLGTNLSSPESAYSTGYSTDGTSPGVPPDCYNKKGTTSVQPNILEKGKQPTIRVTSALVSKECRSPQNRKRTAPTVHFSEHSLVSVAPGYDNDRNHSSPKSLIFCNNYQSANSPHKINDAASNSGITSPRQRTRIRTNPWLPGNNLSPGKSYMNINVSQDAYNPPVLSSSNKVHYLKPNIVSSPTHKVTVALESMSSSSSSPSTSSINWNSCLASQSLKLASDDDEDCTLNEMMGKYDESYVYEKETDILSDNDLTDYETDIDTGQDGGDEDDALEHELDFIDNGSYLEFNPDFKDIKNTGHCTYFNYEIQRKLSCRHPNQKSQKNEIRNQATLKRTSTKRRHTSNKKSVALPKQTSFRYGDGSKSAGSTPISGRRTKYPTPNNIMEDSFEGPSKSVSFSKDLSKLIAQRDKEADKKYKELILEAEHILKTIKLNGLSPRRLPVLANKRVETLRNAESVKPDGVVRNRPIEDMGKLNFVRIPSITITPPGCSPKKNHITKFIHNNSPILMREEFQTCFSPMLTTKEIHKHNFHSTIPGTPKSDLTLSNNTGCKKKTNESRISNEGRQNYFSSDSDDEESNIVSYRRSGFRCPQSEPVKRKIYSNNYTAEALTQNTASISNVTSSMVKTKLSIFNISDNEDENDWCNDSSENIRQQVLLNTIRSLKRSLEDQSASLRQTYEGLQDRSCRV